MLLSDSAAEKLARVLLAWLDKTHDTRAPGQFRFTLTHEEMAQMIGTSRETVTRQLAVFRRKRFIQQNGSTMFVRNRMALDSMYGDLCRATIVCAHSVAHVLSLDLSINSIAVAEEFLGATALVGWRMFKREPGVAHLIDLDPERHSSFGTANGNGLPVYLSEIGSMYLQSPSGRLSTTRPRSCASL